MLDVDDMKNYEEYKNDSTTIQNWYKIITVIFHKNSAPWSGS